MRTALACLTLALLAAGRAAAQDPSKDDLAAFKDYLEKNHKGKKWQVGPSALASAELEKAYPGRRFCFVFSAPPLPPGAFLPELVERHRKAMEDYRANYLSLTASVEKDGVRPLTKPSDYNRGLIKVASAEDAAPAAAAILSLYPGTGQGTAPTAVKADEVRVTKTGAGWTCSVTRASNFAGTVVFSPTGECMRVTKASLAPLPPVAPPRP
jgi:hypothetical protein